MTSYVEWSSTYEVLKISSPFVYIHYDVSCGVSLVAWSATKVRRVTRSASTTHALIAFIVGVQFCQAPILYIFCFSMWIPTPCIHTSPPHTKYTFMCVVDGGGGIAVVRYNLQVNYFLGSSTRRLHSTASPSSPLETIIGDNHIIEFQCIIWRLNVQCI